MRIHCAVLGGLLALVCPGAHAESQTVVLSIEGVQLGAKQYIAGFEIKTWAVYPLAVCHIPHGWEVSAGTDIDPGGRLTGGSGGTVANLDHTQLTDLKALYLVKVDGYHATTVKHGGSEQPASFSGTISIGTYGSEKPDHDYPLRPANIVMVPAKRCPG